MIRMKLKCQCGYEIKQEHGHQEDIKSGVKTFFFKCSQCGKCYTHIRYLSGAEKTVEGYQIVSQFINKNES